MDTVSSRESVGSQLRPELALIAVGSALAAAGFGLAWAVRWELITRLPGGFLSSVPLILLAVGGSLLALGLWLYVFPPTRAGEAPRGAPPGSHRVVLSSVALLVVASNLLATPLMAATGASSDLRSVAGFVTAVVILAATVALFLTVWIRRHSGSPQAGWRALGIRLQRGLLSDLGVGLAGGMAVFLAAAGVQLALQGLGIVQTQLEQFRWMAELPTGVYLGLAFLGVVIGPAAEEAFFRGFVFQTYLKSKGPLVAYVGSSALFASLHLNLQAALPIFVMGLMLGFLFHRTGSLVPGLVAHGFNNAVAFAALYALRSS